MSILIKGMEMPKDGSWRSIRIYPDGTIGRPIGFGDYALVEGAKAIPAADVRPVITCGECKHWFENGTDYCSCDRDALLRERDFFCADGEKREES